MKEILNIYKEIFLGYWWIISPVALFFIFKYLWLTHVRTNFLKSLKWIVLEIRFPREIVKTPKAMEQFFAGLHAAEKTPKKFKEIYLKGELPTWFSIETIGQGGKIRFFIRTQSKFRNLIESSLYAQYPGTEIHEVDDYVDQMPKNIPKPNKEYDAWGTELILTKPDAYPIRTYPVFFEEKEAEERTDPLAGLFEFLSSLDSKENIGIQILISPTGDDWKKEGEKQIAKIIGKEVKEDKKGKLLIVEETSNWIQALINGITEFLFGAPVGGEKKEEKPVANVVPFLTPGQKEVVSAMENNMGKIGFKTIIRFLYWAPKEIFSKDKTTVAAGFFRQFNTQNLNGFKANKAATPGRGKIFKKRREPGQKRFLVRLYKKRYFPFKTFIKRGFVFNIEELATIFHVPGKFVEAERLSKIEAKKGSPPANLPIE